jgi:hypothetical protein
LIFSEKNKQYNKGNNYEYQQHSSPSLSIFGSIVNVNFYKNASLQFGLG